MSTSVTEPSPAEPTHAATTTLDSAQAEKDQVVRRTKEKLAGTIQAVGHRPHDIPRRRWESLAIFAFFAVAYIWFGYWLVAEMHVVSFETLDRLNRSLMVWHNDPAKLSAIGFDYPPLATLLISPLTLIPALARSLVIVPVASALFAAATMVLLNSMLRRAQVQTALRYAVLLAVGANPLVLLYGAGGSRHFIWISLVMAAVGALFAWYVTADIRFVMIAGLAFSIATLAGYSSLIWFAIGALMIGSVLSRLGARGEEIEGTTVGYAAPTAYVIALWTAFNLILLSNPFAWITTSNDAAASGATEHFSLLELAQYTGQLVLYGAPLAIVVLPALIFAGFKNNSFALWLAVMLGAAILSPAVSVALGLADAPMLMRNALPILLFAVVGAIWLARSLGTQNAAVSAILVAILVVSIPWTFHAMKTYRYQNLESAFAAALSTGESQEGAKAVGGGTIGVVSEQAMADYIRANIDEDDSILTDNAQTYAVMLLTGDPALFFDRVDRSDGPWQAAAKDPAGADVKYLLLSTDTSDDLLSQLYTEAVDGTDPMLPELFSTPRYRLVGVPAAYQREDAGDSADSDSSDESTSTPAPPTGGSLGGPVQ